MTGPQVRAIRESMKLSAVEMSGALGLRPDYYLKIEQGNLPLSAHVRHAVALMGELYSRGTRSAHIVDLLKRADGRA